MRYAVFVYVLPFVCASQVCAAVSTFCEPQAIAAAKALAGVNGSASASATARVLKDGKTFVVKLSEDGMTDEYRVNTSGGHECSVKSVSIRGTPSRRS